MSATHAEKEEATDAELNTDVIVQLNSGDVYVATFCSYKCLETLLEKHRSGNEEQSPDHYEVLNVVLVNDSVKGDLLPVVEHMMSEGDFQLVFKKM